MATRDILFNHLHLTIWLARSLVNHHHHPRLLSNNGICALFLVNINQENENQPENLWLGCNNENKRTTYIWHDVRPYRSH
jgi:hypothetical protein